jgi:hypothetical protein
MGLPAFFFYPGVKLYVSLERTESFENELLRKLVGSRKKGIIM